MKDHDEETELIKRALNAFREATGFRANVVNLEPTLGGPLTADALLRFAGPGTAAEFLAEVKKGLTAATIGAVIERLKRFPQKVVLIAEYINPNMADKLKQMDVPFIDTVGNLYLNEPPLLLYIKGQGPPKAFRRARLTRAFQPTGLKVIFAFFCRPELIRLPYREIARAAGVALGTVGWVVADLKDLGFWLDMGKRGRRLTRKEKLLERWATAYAEQLRPKLLIGRFAAPDAEWWKRTRLQDFKAYWGGEVAAARLTDYLKPAFVTIYTREAPAKLQLVNKLKEHAQGKIELLKIFWKPECDWANDNELVHPFLVYADLLATGDPRNIEVARIIHDDQLARLVGED